MPNGSAAPSVAAACSGLSWGGTGAADRSDLVRPSGRTSGATGFSASGTGTPDRPRRAPRGVATDERPDSEAVTVALWQPCAPSARVLASSGARNCAPLAELARLRARLRATLTGSPTVERPEREHWSERLVLIADELTSNALRHGGAPVADGPEPDRRPVAGRRQRLLHRGPPAPRPRAATPGSAGSASTWWPTSPSGTAGPRARGAKTVWAVVTPTTTAVHRSGRPPLRAGNLAGNLRHHVARRADGHGHRRLRGHASTGTPPRRPSSRPTPPPARSSACSRCTTPTPSARPSSAARPAAAAAGPRSGFDGRKAAAGRLARLPRPAA